MERYDARRIRDRFDRELLVDYLAALGIAVDDPDFYGDGRTLRQRVPWKSREVTVAQYIAESQW
ncbi:hypothetical protein [Salsipaludibacter albus]|uniref:hypothetical protein n=1 Tax=Salsipaludibacter albus TaxID=2849650 RepID=UPI001EE43DE3|nr:hypothetical protein [Salsipaludibacter albus]MBY5163697.1 hypothetical protein [Salsipaludibacter albus]